MGRFAEVGTGTRIRLPVAGLDEDADWVTRGGVVTFDRRTGTVEGTFADGSAGRGWTEPVAILSGGGTGMEMLPAVDRAGVAGAVEPAVKVSSGRETGSGRGDGFAGDWLTGD